ncbi:MAG: DUF3055 domain-containing protein [Tepidibacillus sp.]
MNENMFVLYEENEQTDIKYISFVGASNSKFDLAIIHTGRFYGKNLVINIQSGRTAIIGKDDLEEPGFLEEAYQITEEEAKDLYDYLIQYY